MGTAWAAAESLIYSIPPSYQKKIKPPIYLGLFKESFAQDRCDALITKTQQQILRLLFGLPDKSFYSKELVNRAGKGTGTVLRELENQLGRQVNPTIYTDEEFKNKIILLIGSESDIPTV